MPLNDLMAVHMTPEQYQQITVALNTVIDTLRPLSINLTDDERRSYGAINQQNKLLVQKVRELVAAQPTYTNARINWNEFQADYADRDMREQLLDLTSTVVRLLGDAKIVYDRDLWTAALRQYRYVRSLADEQEPGATEVYNMLKQFFPRTKGEDELPEAPAES